MLCYWLIPTPIVYTHTTGLAHFRIRLLCLYKIYFNIVLPQTPKFQELFLPRLNFRINATCFIDSMLLCSVMWKNRTHDPKITTAVGCYRTSLGCTNRKFPFQEEDLIAAGLLWRVHQVAATRWRTQSAFFSACLVTRSHDMLQQQVLRWPRSCELLLQVSSCNNFEDKRAKLTHIALRKYGTRKHNPTTQKNTHASSAHRPVYNLAFVIRQMALWHGRNGIGRRGGTL